MISYKKAQALESLLNCASLSEAIKESGIAASTFARYMKDPEFIKEYDDRRREMIQANCRLLQNNTRKAIERLIQIIESDDVADMVRVKAINSLLEHSYKMTEQMEILDRIKVLERKLDDEQRN